MPNPVIKIPLTITLRGSRQEACQKENKNTKNNVTSRGFSCLEGGSLPFKGRLSDQMKEVLACIQLSCNFNHQNYAHNLDPL